MWDPSVPQSSEGADIAHPLIGSCGPSEDDLVSSNVTRPALRRLLGEPVDDGQSSTRPPSPVEALPTNDELIIHEVAFHNVRRISRSRIGTQVSPLDSLASIAIKYKVPLSELRRLNKLWSSDTVHLRKTLVIPNPRQSRVISRDREGGSSIQGKETLRRRRRSTKQTHDGVSADGRTDDEGGMASSSRIRLSNGAGFRLSGILDVSRELIASRLSLDTIRGSEVSDNGDHELTVVHKHKHKRYASSVSLQMPSAPAPNFRDPRPELYKSWGTLRASRSTAGPALHSSQPKPVPAMKVPDAESPTESRL